MSKSYKKLSKCVGNMAQCYGCGMCAAVCPTNVLKMQINSLGFLVPRINNADACTNCGLCSKVCNYNCDEAPTYNAPLSTYAGWSHDNKVREICSSGGIGYEIARTCLSDGYKVCAARYDAATKRVEHYIAESEYELRLSAGSKYLQSDTTKAFKSIDRRMPHIIIGTPCQIDMWRRYLKLTNKEHNFILVDFFCHGIPSYNVWTKYLSENKTNMGTYSAVTWRDKINGWHDSWNIATYSSKNFWTCRPHFRSNGKSGDSFYFMFLSNCALNPACYSKCKYKEFNSSADIRLGDLWGRLYTDNKLGVSAILSYTSRGEQVLKTINAKLAPCSLHDVSEGQMKHSISKPWYYQIVAKAIKLPFIKLTNIRKCFVISEIIGYQFSKICKKK